MTKCNICGEYFADACNTDFNISAQISYSWIIASIGNGWTYAQRSARMFGVFGSIGYDIKGAALSTHVLPKMSGSEFLYHGTQFVPTYQIESPG